MEEKQQIALPEIKLPATMFPAAKDGGENKVLSIAQVEALIAWGKNYGLDAWQGHVLYMYGKPYVTERGAVANAQTYPEYNGFVTMSLDPDAREARGLARDGYAYLCAVYIKSREHPIEDFGEVSMEEIERAKERYGEGVKFLPIFNSPAKMAYARAIRRAHLLAFPLKKKGEQEVK